MDSPANTSITDLAAEQFEISIWGMAAGLAIGAVIAFYSHAKWHYYAWRIDRALSSRYGIPQEELRDLEWRQGDEPKPVEIGQLFLDLMKGLLAMAAFQTLPGILRKSGMPFSQIAGIAVALAILWYAIGRSQSEPAELMDRPLVESSKHHEIPREAIMGFVGAIAFIGLIVLLIVYVAPF